MSTFLKITALISIYFMMSVPNARSSCDDAQINCYQPQADSPTWHLVGAFWVGAKWATWRCCAIKGQAEQCNQKVLECNGKCKHYDVFPYLCTVD